MTGSPLDARAQDELSCSFAESTTLIHSTSRSAQQAGLLNPPVHRASTIVYDRVEDYIDTSLHDALSAEGFFQAMQKKYGKR